MKKILHYHLADKIADGRYGPIYPSWDNGLDRGIVLEMIEGCPVLDAEIQDHFLEQMRLLTQLEKNPHIGAFYSLERSEGKSFIVREYVEGKTLKELICTENFAYGEFLNYAIQMAKGLKAIHEIGLIHGQVCPMHIIITPVNRVKFINTSLPLKLEESPGQSHLNPFDFYLAPEQITGEKITSQTDCFSLGVVFYEMLTRHLPFVGGDRQTLYQSIDEEDPDLEIFQKKRIPPDARLLIEKMLSKDPQDRFDSDDELLITLEEMADYHIKAAGYAQSGEAYSSPRKYIMLSVLAILIIILWLVISNYHQ